MHCICKQRASLHQAGGVFFSGCTPCGNFYLVASCRLPAYAMHAMVKRPCSDLCQDFSHLQESYQETAVLPIIQDIYCIEACACQVAQRHWNAHAFINIAVWLAVDAGNASADPATTSAAATIRAARVVFGYPATHKGESLLLKIVTCPFL